MGRTATAAFLNQSDERAHTARDLILYYVVYGSANIVCSGQHYLLEREDILVVNRSEQYELHLKNSVIARVVFHHEEVYAMLQGAERHVQCCSIGVRDGSYNALRFQIQMLLNALLEEKLGGVAFEKNSCALLLTLLSEFSVESPAQDRKQQVAQWIDNVSREPVTLEDAAAHFHLTPQYFSRWFPSAFGCTFLKYLSRVRCEKAQVELLEGDASILRIAMDQGFPNAASFSKAFSLQYGETPMQFRRTHTSKYRQGILSPKEVEPYLNKVQAEEWSHSQVHRVQVDCKGPFPNLDPYWNRLCCLGRLSMLADPEVQNQVRELQDELYFRSVRLLLSPGAEGDYYLEDKAVSFLRETGLQPLFVADFGSFAGEKGYLRWLQELLRHLVFRFGIREFHLEALFDTAFTGKEREDYRDFLQSLRAVFRSLGVNGVLYGPGLHLTADGANLARCMGARPGLDCYTIRCAPVGIVRAAEVQVRSIPEADYLLHQYRLGQEIIKRNGVSCGLLITGWETSLGTRNPLNDSSWLAAKIVKTALRGYGVLPSLPLECPLDLLDESVNRRKILYGRRGMITLDGLRKPSFYALRFLKHLDTFCLYHDEHLIVTMSGDGYFQIVLQNSSPLSHQYYIHKSEETTANPAPLSASLFEEKQPWQMRLCLAGVQNGKWLMKTRRVNESVGNVFSAWLYLNYEENTFLGRDEMEVLRAKSLPDIQGGTLTSRSGMLDVPITLEPNEIRHIHLIPQKII